MRKMLLILALAPVLLFTLVIASANYTLACHCEDVDQDGYGAPGSTPVLCEHPQVDCDDDPSDDPAGCATCTCGEADCALCARCINAGASEAAYGDAICADTVDNDCDGDIDGSDVGCQECAVPEDCDDGNPCTDDACDAGFCAYTNNSAPCNDGNICTMDDVCTDGACAGVPTDLDQDQDGYVDVACGGDDCDDSRPDVRPGVFEAPPEDPVCSDGIDNNCNGYTDTEDAGCRPRAGWTVGGEADAAVYDAPSREGSRLSNLLFALLLPVGAVVILRRAFRKK